MDVSFIKTLLKECGEIALKSFGEISEFTQKEDPSQIVTEVDLAIEKRIIATIERKYPTHSIIAEETGLRDKKSEYTWIIDPLDGTSNYANAIPWFGVMIALLKNWQPEVAGIYLPITDELYLAEKGNGATKNGQKISVSKETDLKNCLVSFGTDPAEKEEVIKEYAEIYKKLLPKVRNLRSTNSAVDYVYTADGRFGGLINTNNALWDVAPIILIAKEAGAIVTDLKGQEIELKITPDSLMKKFTLVIGSKTIHPELIACTN